jgi:choline dehydrogenase
VFPRIPGFFIVTAIYMVAEKASALIAAAASDSAPAGGPPSELRQVLARLPHPRKPARSTAVEEIR